MSKELAGNNKGTNCEEILEALDGAPQGLDVDSLVAVLALTNCMEVDQSLIELLKGRKITARYNGDRTKDIDTAQFVYCKVKDEENKIGD